MKRNDILAIIYSDEHIALWKSHNKDLRRTNNSLRTLKHLRFLAKQTGAPLLFCGDMFHKEDGISNKLFSMVMPKFSYLYGDSETNTYGITGNHDQSEANFVNNPSPSYIQALADTFPGFHCLDFKTKDFGDWTVSGIPYLTHDLGLLESVQKISIDHNKYNVLMLHTTLPGAKDNDGRVMHSNFKETEFEKAILKFDLVLCGHIHKPHRYMLMTTDIVQVGATKHQRLTDSGSKLGYWILYKNYELKFVELDKYPKFIKLAPGEKAPDDKNFYIPTVKQKKRKKSTKHRFTKSDSKKQLAKKYIKEKKIKNKRKKNALIETLKSVE